MRDATLIVLGGLPGTVDVPGLVLPSWRQVTGREYEPWDREHLVVDTATTSADRTVDLIVERVRRSPST